MNQAQVIKAFRRHRPKNEVDAMRNCRVSLTHLASGAFRHTYQVGSLPLVAKFPRIDVVNKDADGTTAWYNDCVGNVEHARIEMRSLNKVLHSKRKFKAVRQYMPKVYYFSETSGVILMRQYKMADNAAFREQCSIVAQLLHDIDGDTRDVHKGNCGVDDDGKLVILDLGMFEPYHPDSEDS